MVDLGKRVGGVLPSRLHPLEGEDGISACTGVLASVSPHQNRFPQDWAWLGLKDVKSSPRLLHHCPAVPTDFSV